MKTRVTAGVLLVVLLASCTEHKLTRKWTMTGTTETSLIFSLLKALKDTSMPDPNSVVASYDYFYRFYPDHTFTTGSKTDFVHGTWELDGKNLTLKMENGKRTLTYQLEELSSEKIVLKLTDEKLGSNLSKLMADMMNVKLSDVRLTGEADTYDYSEDDDIYGLALNVWRIKPTRRQSEAQLKERLRNHLDYVLAWLTVAIEREAGEMDLSNLTSPIMLSVSGVGLKFFDDSPEFNATFFDETDARTAHDLMTRAVETGAQRFQTRNKSVREELKEEYEDETNRGLAYFRAYLEEVKAALK